MRDTSPEIAEVMRTMYDSLSPEQKLMKVSSLFSTAKKAAQSAILREYPTISEKELNLKVFRWLYQSKLSEEFIQGFEKYYRQL